MRDPSYGEIAYLTFHRLTTFHPAIWDEIDQETKHLWENTAATVLAQYHKRQAALAKQTKLNEPVPDGPAGAMKPRFPVDPTQEPEPSQWAHMSSDRLQLVLDWLNQQRPQNTPVIAEINAELHSRQHA